MARAVSATIESPVGTAREGLRVDFHAEPPGVSTFAVTDAGGVFTVQLEPGITYRVPVYNAVIVNGQAFAAGTVFVVVVPAGEGPVSVDAALAGVVDASLPALLATLADLQTRLAMLEPPVEGTP